jgi:protein-L-isoaspartate(D-aspartate) O-methyltransferase
LNGNRISGSMVDMALDKKRLVEHLVSYGYIQTEIVKNAMQVVPREEFLPDEQKPYAYLDRPLPIGEGQTISAPHMVAIICEKLSLEQGMTVLEIGAGFGYNAAVVAEIVGDKGHVYSIERIESLVKIARDNLKRTTYDKRVTVIAGDGSLGLPEYAPFNRIYVTAAAPQIPEPLKDQLVVGGILVVPVGERDSYQELILIEKIDEDEFKTINLGGVAFVPLIGKHGW